MKKFLNKAKASLNPGQTESPPYQGQQQQKVIKQDDTGSYIQPPSPLDVLRYRYNHGTNLGSVFVLEKWLNPSMFVAGAQGESELDAVHAYVQNVKTPSQDPHRELMYESCQVLEPSWPRCHSCKVGSPLGQRRFRLRLRLASQRRALHEHPSPHRLLHAGPFVLR